MPRMPRIHIEQALYYVTSRGDHNWNIFKDKEDYWVYLDLLRKYKEQYEFKLFSYVFLPNHLHLLIELKENLTISAIMHDINSSYIKYFNKKYRRKGHLFQERYKLNLLEKQPYLFNMTAYIHLNPYKLGLTKTPEEYPYSSCGLYQRNEELKNEGNTELDLKEEVQEVLQAASCGLQATGKIEYEDFLMSLKQNETELLGKDLHKKVFLGSGEFLESIKSQVARHRLQTKGNPRIHKRFVLAGGLVVLTLFTLITYFYRMNVGLIDRFKTTLQMKERESREKIKREKERLRKDLEEKYGADMVSYQAMVEKLELEKRKTKDLEEE